MSSRELLKVSETVAEERVGRSGGRSDQVRQIWIIRTKQMAYTRSWEICGSYHEVLHFSTP